MWPNQVDIDAKECKSLLRTYEITAYAAVLDAFVAQGDLSIEKKKILIDLSDALSISFERHRSEVRRALSDEILNTISHKLIGGECRREWLIEGKRVIPLLPRSLPLSMYFKLSNACATTVTKRDSTLPHPSTTRSLSRWPEAFPPDLPPIPSPIPPQLGIVEQPNYEECVTGKRKKETFILNDKRLKTTTISNTQHETAPPSTIQPSTSKSAPNEASTLKPTPESWFNIANYIKDHQYHRTSDLIHTNNFSQVTQLEEEKKTPPESICDDQVTKDTALSKTDPCPTQSPPSAKSPKHFSESIADAPQQSSSKAIPIGTPPSSPSNMGIALPKKTTIVIKKNITTKKVYGSSYSTIIQYTKACQANVDFIDRSSKNGLPSNSQQLVEQDSHSEGNPLSGNTLAPQN